MRKAGTAAGTTVTVADLARAFHGLVALLDGDPVTQRAVEPELEPKSRIVSKVIEELPP